MFKPAGYGNEWVPVKTIDWTWTGNAAYQSYLVDSDSRGWIAQDCMIIPGEPVAQDTT